MITTNPRRHSMNRALKAGRSDCAAQANAQHRRDIDEARSLLLKSRRVAD